MNNEQWSDFRAILEGNLITGRSGKVTDKNAPNHHNQMNLDNNKKGKGAEKVTAKDGKTVTKHEIAVDMATKDIEKRL
jgi:hypothetical protein